MTDPDIIEAAARALFVLDETAGLDNTDMNHIARAVLAAVTRMIRAAALEEAAQVAEGYDGAFETQGVIAADIRALKEQP